MATSDFSHSGDSGVLLPLPVTPFDPDDPEKGSPRFTLRELDTGETLALVLEGEVDLSCAADLASRLNNAVSVRSRSTIVVDLSGCDYMDSSGLKVLIGAERLARERRRRLIFARPSRNLRRTFDIMQLGEYLTITETWTTETQA
jgi:anti-anti-sigma factor